MQQLSRKNYNAVKRPIRIVQFGEGNFLRAFVDNFIQILNDRELIHMNVAVVQPLPLGRIDAMTDQDGLYTLFLEGIQNGQVIKQHRVIDVISQLVDPHKDLVSFLSLARSAELQIVFSNTTEAGISFEAEPITFDVLPQSFPGKLLQFLYARYLAFLGDPSFGLEIIPCELIDYNGDTLRSVLLELAAYNQMDQAFIDWVKNANHYYNTLVDRIVPGYPKDNASELEAMLGYHDHSMVKGEIFHLWVIDGEHTDKLSAMLPFEKAGIQAFYVPSIVPYKQRKVKILNGSHTALVPIAYQMGIDAVREAITEPRIQKFVNGFVFDEVVPTIPLPKADMDAFASSVFERYANPFIHHLLLSIALNSVSKYKQRILPTLLQSEKIGTFPAHALFSLAALIVFYRGIDPRGGQIPLKEEPKFLDLFQKFWSQSDVSAVVKGFLSLDYWETDFLKQKPVLDFVTEWAVIMVNQGMSVALDRFLSR